MPPGLGYGGLIGLGTAGAGTTYAGGGGVTINGRSYSDDDIQGIAAYLGRIGEEDARRFDQNFGLQERQLGLTAEQQQAAREQVRRALAENKRQFDLTFGEGSRRYDQDFGEGRRRYDQDFGEGRRRFDTGTGLDILETGATMRGPLNAFQGDAFARGVAGNPGLSPALAALQANVAPGYGGGTATAGNPIPLTPATLAGEFSARAPVPGVAGTSPAPGTASAGVDAYGRPMLSPAYQQNLDAIDTVARRGLANLPLGALEGLTGSEQQSFVSGLDYLGRNSGAELQMYKRSRPGQRSAMSA